MTVEEVMNALTITDVVCKDNAVPSFVFIFGMVMFVAFLVSFVKNVRFERVFSAFAMAVSVFWCVIGLKVRWSFPTLVTLKVEFEPNAVTGEQLGEYFKANDLSWYNGKITCTLSPVSDYYDEVLEILNVNK